MVSTQSHTSPDPAGDPPPQRAIAWVTFGISKPWIGDYLEPICWSWEDSFQRLPNPDGFQALLAEKVDWDVLFLGSDLHEPMRAETLEAAVEAICRRHPLKCVIAVTPTTSYRRQLTLMQLGAVEVLTLDAAPTAIERIIDRVIAVARARHAQIDHDKLKLLNHLAVSVNHEINNPLTGLMGTAELLLLEGHKLDEKVRRDLRTIIAQCRRIQEVTTQLKNLNHMRTVPYGKHDEMIDLIGQPTAGAAPEGSPATEDLIFPAPVILVVDDNPLITDLIARLFEQRFRIDAATGATEALSLLNRTAYDLIL
ncbi:MAG: hypothetical protein M1457_12325, partial [bacterium]|nr:hypothetical protein [bacterium]